MKINYDGWYPSQDRNPHFDEFTRRARYFEGSTAPYAITVCGKTLRADSTDTLYDLYVAEIEKVEAKP